MAKAFFQSETVPCCGHAPYDTLRILKEEARASRPVSPALLVCHSDTLMV
jgi:hypothetical protein